MHATRRALATFLTVLCALGSAFAQETNTLQRAPPEVKATATAGRIRFVAPSTVSWIHVDVYDAAGQEVFNSETSGGNVLDWYLQDGKGEPLKDSSYLVVLSVKNASGSVSQRHGTLIIENSKAIVQPLTADKEASLTMLQEGETQTPTVIAHDGKNGQINRGKGALSFRLGDFYSGKDTEQMRLSEEGNLGIGTDTPEARLDVNGMIRARSGFQFSDGSILDLSPKGGGLRVTLPGGKSLPVNLAPNAVVATQYKIPKYADAGGTLTDSTIFEDATGRVGIGTTTPQHPFSVRRNGGTLGVHTVGELYVDRDDRTRSASMVLGTAGTLKWIFGMPYQSDGFQIFDLQASPAPGVSRFFVDPTSGNIGIGTNSPTARLTVSGEATITPAPGGGSMHFGSPNGERGMTINGNSFNTRADVRFDGQTLKLVTGPNTGPPSSANGIAIDTSGNVGIGTNTPRAKLEVGGNVVQNRSANGLVKAMLHVDEFGRIISCYNGVINPTVIDCGFSIAHSIIGVYSITFNFQVNDRFVSVTPAEHSAFFSSHASFQFITPNNIEVNTVSIALNAPNYQRSFLQSHPFMLIIY